MKSNNIDSRHMIMPISHALHFKDMFIHEKFTISEAVSKNSVHLPSSTNLLKKDIYNICNLVKFFLNSQ